MLRGKHISHDELLRGCHAVLYAVGAAKDRALDIPGADLPGNHSATEVVDRIGWPAIDSAERAADASRGRPGTKLIAREHFLSAARGQ